MGYTSRYDALETIELGDGYKVQVKRCLTGDEMDRCRRETMKWRTELVKVPDGNGGFDEQWRAVLANVDPTLLSKEWAIASIMEWNIDDAEGKVLPLHCQNHQRPEASCASCETIRRTNFGLLTYPDQEKIEEVVGGFNAEPTREETVRFPEGRESSTSTGDDASSDDKEVRPGEAVLGKVGPAPRPSSVEREAVA